MGWACSTHRKGEKCIQDFGRGIEGRIILGKVKVKVQSSPCLTKHHIMKTYPLLN
jgi:hypothetical protein